MLVDKDVVLWCTRGTCHVPRLELTSEPHTAEWRVGR